MTTDQLFRTDIKVRIPMMTSILRYQKEPKEENVINLKQKEKML